MAQKQVALEVAAFLDSSQAQALGQQGVSRAHQQELTEIFLEICYEEIGKKPRLFDGQDVHAALGHLMPAHLARKDPRAEHVPALLAAFFEHLETRELVPQSFEIRRGLEATVPEFLETVRTGHNAHHHHAPRQAPFVHQAEKLGRNDPCSCGSGKKYKKCHGKDA